MMIADAAQRAEAIDSSRSFIVQAPAGSGKTELLTQRFLALLAEVERPTQILAITFTRKAAGEMRERLLAALRNASENPQPQQQHEALTWQLASKALDRHGLDLLRNPAQLGIQTIDSFNASLVRKMPWLSRFGSLPELADHVDPLYRQAAERLLLRLDEQSPDGELLRRLLAHLDNQLAHLQTMLVEMLRKRDQWLRHILGTASQERTHLESGLGRLIADQLEALVSLFPAELVPELLACIEFASSSLDHGELDQLVTGEGLPVATIESLEEWQKLADFLLTSTGSLRKSVNKNNGFPSGRENAAAKRRMLELLEELSRVSELEEQLALVRGLPAGYNDDQWRILEALIKLLPLLVAELWLVFRQQAKADFAAVALQAKAALGSAEKPEELLLQIDNELRHILVDEFQDTSWLQYELLQLLTSGWMPGDGRTLFLVGDPMQSIYRFREAEVGLFLETFSGRLGTAGLLLEPLRLSCNFRSQQGIVDWVNRTFGVLFPDRDDPASGAVSLALADAVRPPENFEPCVLYPFAGQDDRAEAERVVEIIRQRQAEEPDATIAILVRGRTHLREILPLLRERKIAYLAQDIDQLDERPAVSDLFALCRALLLRGDRLAWLTLLRAPWCGLTLTDLHTLVADQRDATVVELLADELRLSRLSIAGQTAVARVLPILERAISRRGRLTLRNLLEGTWLALGGPACYGDQALADAELFFNLLESLEEGAELPSFEVLEERLKALFAAVDASDDRVQIMTIHKAKGLQFDTVILPGLGKTTGRPDVPLLRWQQHPDYGLLLAPLAAKDSTEKDPLYQLIGRLEKRKQELELARLLYVATTRAETRVHLLGHAEPNKDDQLVPKSGSLLEQLWPLVVDDFTTRAEQGRAEESIWQPPQLRRLSADWQPPLTVPLDIPRGVQQKSASDKEEGEFRENLFSGWESESKRHIGTLVHHYLERIARFGVDSWGQLTPREQLIRRQLSGYGVPVTELDNGTAMVIRAVEQTISAERGSWVLHPHQDHACELALTGLVDGDLIHAVIDRTFVVDGVRWVIDYKTTAPGGKESLEHFFERQRQQYTAQLQVYRQLFRLRDEQLPIRAALYFPLFDGWCEL